MSWLTLVRHAQASFHADDYDQLSSLGQRQACLLGEAWVRERSIPDEVYVGPRSRQRQTVDLVAVCYERAGLSFPRPIVLQELDEYDLNGIMEQLGSGIVRGKMPSLRAWSNVIGEAQYESRSREEFSNDVRTVNAPLANGEIARGRTRVVDSL